MKFILVIYNKTDGSSIAILPVPFVKSSIKLIDYDEWNTPLFHTYIKESYFIVKKFFTGELK